MRTERRARRLPRAESLSWCVPSSASSSDRCWLFERARCAPVLPRSAPGAYLPCAAHLLVCATSVSMRGTALSASQSLTPRNRSSGLAAGEELADLGQTGAAVSPGAQSGADLLRAREPVSLDRLLQSTAADLKAGADDRARIHAGAARAAGQKRAACGFVELVEAKERCEPGARGQLRPLGEVYAAFQPFVDYMGCAIDARRFIAIVEEVSLIGRGAQQGTSPGGRIG